MSMTDEDRAKLVKAVQQLHVDSLHSILHGVESIIDGRVAAVYIARAGQILATLRKYKATNEAEIAALAEHLVESAMSDENAGGAHTEDGLPVLTPDDKKRLH